MSIFIEFEPIKNYQLCRLFTVKVLKAVRQMPAEKNNMAGLTAKIAFSMYFFFVVVISQTLN